LRSLNEKPEIKPGQSEAAVDFSSFVPGTKVRHKLFGEGLIIELIGEMPDLKASIDFYDKGTKTILLKYAKLEILA
jgi:DNA helicase-2/ATP-dependent DNA helicase PcrA